MEPLKANLDLMSEFHHDPVVQEALEGTVDIGEAAASAADVFEAEPIGPMDSLK